MANIFIFHGTGGHSQENWFPWMKTELEKLGNTVIVPDFPTPEGQSLEAWLKILREYESKIDEEAILIGHSLGGLFLLRVLESLPKTVRLAVFVSAPNGVQPIRNYDADKAFSPNGFDFDWDTIQSHAQQFVVFHSDTDPYVSLGNGENLAKQLDTQLTFVPNAGHFNATAGYTQFDQLLTLLKEALQNK